MCGRYTLINPKKIKKRFDTENDAKEFDKSYNIAPSMYLPTITKNSPNKIIFMRWGFVPDWSKGKKFSMINIRDDTLKTKIYFQNKLHTNRCLVPADGFFEWKRVKTKRGVDKIPYYIYIKNNPLFSFAGIYNKLHDAEGKDIHTFAIVTAKPNHLVKDIHDRMPVILERKDEDRWLKDTNDVNNYFPLLRPYPPAKMEAHKISLKVNSPSNDSPDIINPV
jgi:putative SOS response-associated peptidase YedK